MLLSKLPGKLRDRWNREVYSIRAKHSREPELKDLINYVDQETTLVSGPLIFKEVVVFGKRDVTVDKTRRLRGYAIRSGEKSKNKPDKDPKVKDKSVMCRACRYLDDCNIFMSQTVEERSKVLFRNKLCYGCYGCFSKHHSVSGCKPRRSCKLCKEKHPTGLDGFKPKNEGVKQDSGNDDNK